MIKKVSILIAFAALGVFCALAAQAESVRGEGRYVSQTLTQLTPFNAVEVHGDITVEVRQAAAQQVTLHGRANLVALADVRVENNTLMVDYKRPLRVKGKDGLRVTVFVPQLISVTVRHDGKVRLQGLFETPQMTLNAADEGEMTVAHLKTDTARVQVMNKADIDIERLHAQMLEAATFGKAELEVSGYAQSAKFTNNSTQDIDAANLRAEIVHATVNNKGDIEIFATKTLQADANALGTITYHGIPTLTREGNLKKIKPAFDTD
ncbi:MAG: DUF2807 domain-containing protein [Elusimicrobiaceae bacterium]|nr:DUF2807 domain-containing protein [Elusimicrobiaceae bacterium]